MPPGTPLKVYSLVHANSANADDAVAAVEEMMELTAVEDIARWATPVGTVTRNIYGYQNIVLEEPYQIPHLACLKANMRVPQYDPSLVFCSLKGVTINYISTLKVGCASRPCMQTS
jgi:hypothetical protein